MPSLPGWISESEAKNETLRNIKEAIALYLKPVEDDMSYGPDAETTEVAVCSKCRAFPKRSEHHTSSPADQAIYALSHPETGASVSGDLTGANVTPARVSGTAMA